MNGDWNFFIWKDLSINWYMDEKYVLKILRNPTLPEVVFVHQCTLLPLIFK